MVQLCRNRINFVVGALINHFSFARLRFGLCVNARECARCKRHTNYELEENLEIGPNGY